MPGMTALVCTQPGALAIDQRPAPHRAADEVLLHIRRVGTCGTDYHIFEGCILSSTIRGSWGMSFPASWSRPRRRAGLRRDSSSRSIPISPAATCIACRKGKPNCCMPISVLGVHRDGGMCEWLSLPEGNLYPAEGLSLDAAAAVEFLAIGAHAVAAPACGPGARVLVVGAGPIGLAAAIFARIAGADVTMMDRDPGRIASPRAEHRDRGPHARRRGCRRSRSRPPRRAKASTSSSTPPATRLDGEGLRLRRPWRQLCAGERGQGFHHLLGSRIPQARDDPAGQPQRHRRGFQSGDRRDQRPARCRSTSSSPIARRSPTPSTTCRAGPMRRAAWSRR